MTLRRRDNRQLACIKTMELTKYFDQPYGTSCLWFAYQKAKADQA